jgi:hypothetical protein
MEEEPLKLGRLSAHLEKTVGHDFGTNIFVFVSAEKLDEMAQKWPDSYLGKVEEISRIIRHPDYVAYAEKEATLFLIKEYIKDGLFRKVVVDIKAGNRLLYGDTKILTDALSTEISSKSLIKKIN